jgi:hypothetical protein
MNDRNEITQQLRTLIERSVGASIHVEVRYLVTATCTAVTAEAATELSALAAFLTQFDETRTLIETESHGSLATGMPGKKGQGPAQDHEIEEAAETAAPKRAAPSPRRQHLTDAERRRVEELLASNTSRTEIVRLTGLSASSINRVRAAAGGTG